MIIWNDWCFCDIGVVLVVSAVRAALVLCVALSGAGCTAAPDRPIPSTELRPPVRTKLVTKVIERVVYVANPSENPELRDARSDLVTVRANLEKIELKLSQSENENKKLSKNNEVINAPITKEEYRHCQSQIKSSPCENTENVNNYKCKWISSDSVVYPACLPLSLYNRISPPP